MQMLQGWIRYGEQLNVRCQDCMYEAKPILPPSLRGTFGETTTGECE
jgi:hypothetical protein